MQSEDVSAVEGSVAALPAGRWLLAVSGGRDSMALLEAFAKRRYGEIAGVATFDHGTGPAATRAARLVERRALALGLPAMVGAKGKGGVADEATWRAARWRFLNAWGEELRATVVTAHSWDDQVETVLLRLLRGSGTRGLAGMLAPASGRAPVARPFLPLRRGTIAAYASQVGVAFVEDPSNASLAFARNRVRLELLPALERAAPGFADWCWDLSVRAAALRQDLARWVDEHCNPQQASGSGVGVNATPLLTLSAAGAALVWPEIASRAGIAMDRRGIARVAVWATTASVGSRIQLAGGGEIKRTQSAFIVRPVY